MVDMNVFRVLGDVSHTASKCILIWAIHSNKSAEGVSLLTQLLYVLVFCTRYLDLFWVPPSISYWNFVLKNFYILSSIYIIILMTRVYARTRERERAWKLGAYCLGGSVIGAPLVTLIFRGPRGTSFIEILWTFSIILESTCILPQLLLLRQTTVPTVITSFYLLTLGSYRFFYILNWIIRLAGLSHHFDPVAVIFGTLQTLLYLDFAWVYWTRQRVKLRGGGVVDSDDIRRGWLIGKVLGGRLGRGASLDEERPENGHTQGRWGARGISVSADEGVLERHDEIPQKTRTRNGPHLDAEGGNRDELRGILEDDEDESDAEELPSPSHFAKATAPNGIGAGEEWRDGNEARQS
ncbi:MAG: hypothetical protein M1834_009418 [Cirrosporium novae-zelandiae]|nr:MAG: hypothetical protein M1834_009418 [Cirrosporium novae-zelandiae]